MAMRRADRRNLIDDDNVNNPRSRKKEPIPRHDLMVQLQTVRSQKNEINEKLKSTQKAFEEEKEKSEANNQLLLHEKAKYKDLLLNYDNAKETIITLEAKYQEADTLRQKYVTLYSEAKDDLRFERRSKASIKGWQTRRKKENERLKQEIGQMVLVIQESLQKKDQAINNLYILAERMERIQDLVDSVEEEQNSSPIALFDKLKRIWSAIRIILAE